MRIWNAKQSKTNLAGETSIRENNFFIEFEICPKKLQKILTNNSKSQKIFDIQRLANHSQSELNKFANNLGEFYSNDVNNPFRYVSKFGLKNESLCGNIFPDSMAENPYDSNNCYNCIGSLLNDIDFVPSIFLPPFSSYHDEIKQIKAFKINGIRVTANILKNHHLENMGGDRFNIRTFWNNSSVLVHETNCSIVSLLYGMQNMKLISETVMAQNLQRIIKGASKSMMPDLFGRSLGAFLITSDASLVSTIEW